MIISPHQLRQTQISPIEKRFKKYIFDHLANLPSLFGGGGLNSGGSSTYLINGAFLIGGYLFLRKKTSK